MNLALPKAFLSECFLAMSFYVCDSVNISFSKKRLIPEEYKGKIKTNRNVNVNILK